MAKSHIVNNGKRAIFKEGLQKDFLVTAFKKSHLTTMELSRILSVNPRTLNYWRNEQATLPLSALETICKNFKITKPKGIEIRNAFWSNKQSSVLGGNATYKKYGSIGGDEARRKAQWQKWWDSTGHKELPPPFKALALKCPRKSVGLAEFIGIILGDGHISSSQVTITLNATDDILYAQYITELVKKLFDITPSITKRKNMNAVVISISRKKLVEFLSAIGLIPGDKTKHQVDIPVWIKESQIYSKACVRGLIDTDGCVVNECHNIKSKKYCYTRLAFTNASKPLLLSVFKILEGLDFSPKMRNNKRVQVERSEKITRYFKVIGTSNPKHLARFNRFGLKE